MQQARQQQKLLLVLLTLFSSVSGQAIGTLTPENHPAITWKQCGQGGCTAKQGSVVIDANWRWTHSPGTSKNCYDGNKWTSECKDNKSCGKCVVEGAKYQETYGIQTASDALTLKFVTKHQYGTNIGSRVYLMADENKYQMFSLLNKEFTFDVEFPTVSCGLNSALYFISMDPDGGKSKHPGNEAGAKYGLGYCDAQCPRDIKFIDGEGNYEGWSSSASDRNSGTGNKGSCCAEMDIWEANSMSAAYTPHSCKTTSQHTCTGGTHSKTRYAGTCDPDGCDFNSYRMGEPTFYGRGKTVDSNKKFTIVTQFIGNPLKEIKRFYVQDGKVIPNSHSKVPGVTGNSITPEFCDAQNKAFAQTPYDFKDKGGFSSMSAALDKGMVLALSLWSDHSSGMAWLDGIMSKDGSGTEPGAKRGDCAPGAGAPDKVQAESANATVVFSNIKYGELNSTFAAAE